MQVCKLGSFVDIYDSNNSWRVGRIEEINQNGIFKVNFDGWNHNWDEVKFTKYKLIKFF